MKSVVIDRFGEPAQVVHAAELPLPQPGPGEVRVRLLLSPIHNHDLSIIRGFYGYRPPLPAVPGTEALGRVDAVGEGVVGLSVGQRVATASVQSAWAECFVCAAAKLVPVPDGLPDEVACQLLAMPLSALMLLEDMRVPTGQWVVQNAANGAVGKALAAMAAARGVKVLNLVRRDSAVAELAAEGIAHVVSTEQADWKAQAQAIIGQGVVARAIDSIGGEGPVPLMELLSDNGELISFGSLTFKPLVIGANHLIFKQTVVKGYWASKRLAATPPAELARMIGELATLAAQGVLRLPVGGIYPLEQAAQAMAESERMGRGGKVLLRGVTGS